jgi:hypothetical protein
MSIQGNALFYGSFTSDGNARDIQFGTEVSAYFQLNETQFNSTANPGVLKRAWFIRGMADASYMGVQNTNGAATDQSIRGTTDGFTPFRSDELPSFATVAITSVSQASPAVVTATAHGLVTGDEVRLVNVTNMQQLSGITFTATRTGANTFTIPVNTSGFAAAGAGGTIRRVIQNEFVLKQRFITNITQATQAVVTTASDHGFSVGDMVSFRLPDNAAYGMTQLNPSAENGYLRAEIVAVGSVTTFTIDVDTTAFTAWTWPTSANSYNQSRPVVVPVGAAGTSPNYLGDATDNVGFMGLTLGTSVAGDTSDVIRWWAFAGDNLAAFG